MIDDFVIEHVTCSCLGQSSNFLALFFGLDFFCFGFTFVNVAVDIGGGINGRSLVHDRDLS